MKKSQKQPNLIILMTDQQRSIQHFPDHWVKKNLPNYYFLREKGVEFENNICNTSPCGPSRASLFTGLYPAATGITGNHCTVKPEDMNLTNALIKEGYDVYYKGKLHMVDAITDFSESWTSESKEKANTTAQQEDTFLDHKYSLKGWTSPDFGTMLISSDPSIPETYNMAGGTGDNDGRVVAGTKDKKYPDQQSVLEFLEEVQKNKPDKPFCLIVSLLNPHDVSLYPNGWDSAGYADADFKNITSISAPESYSKDNLSTKPAAQTQCLNHFGQLDSSDADNYARFYAYLHTLSDQLMGEVLKAVKSDLLEDSIIIRMADHGEMGMAHGLQEKVLNAYNETIKVPMIWYSPTRFKAGKRKQLVSLIDLAPTLATLASADNTAKKNNLPGVDYSALLSDEKGSTQSALLFNYGSSPASNTPTTACSSSGSETDDLSKATAIPTNIYAIVKENYKYAVYYSLDSNGKLNTKTAQFELYDQVTDPNEIKNLLPVNAAPTSMSLELQIKLHTELTKLMDSKGIKIEGWKSWQAWNS